LRFALINSSTLQLLVQTAFVTAGGVPVDQALSRGAIQQLNGAFPLGWRRGRGAGLLQSRAELGALGAVSDCGCARLPKVLCGRCNSGQGMDSNEAKTVSVVSREA
jgi:hypothetical protein